MAMASVAIQEGKLVSEIRKGVNPEKNTDQADFWLEQDFEDAKGKIYKQKLLCRILGKQALHIPTTLAIGTRIIVEGKLRYKDYLGYVEGYTVSYGDSNA